MTAGIGRHEEEDFGGGAATGMMLGGGASLHVPERSRVGLELGLDYVHAVSGRYSEHPWLRPAVGSYRPRFVAATIGLSFRARRP
jgi:hypothetical protein